MSGGTSEPHYDSEYQVTCVHRGGSGSAEFINRNYKFDAFITVGVYVENVTQSTGGAVTAVRGNTITVDGVTWDSGDVMKSYATATKGSLISQQWVDLSRGWKTPQDELIDGWREEDIDEDRDERKVWGPGQPENYRR